MILNQLCPDIFPEPTSTPIPATLRRKIPLSTVQAPLGALGGRNTLFAAYYIGVFGINSFVETDLSLAATSRAAFCPAQIAPSI